MAYRIRERSILKYDATRGKGGWYRDTRHLVKERVVLRYEVSTGVYIVCMYVNRISRLKENEGVQKEGAEKYIWT